MLRLRFNPEDLARVRLSGVMDPMWEIIGSVHTLQSPRRSALYQGWLTRAGSRLQNPRLHSAARALSAIAPFRTYFPDFLTPDRASRGLDNDIDTILSTPAHRLRSEIGALGHPTGWMAGMADGDPSTLTRFGDLLRLYYRMMIEPEQDRFAAGIAAHRAGVVDTLTHSGTEAMLDGLAPMIRWRPPYLEASYPRARTIDLRGRGLLLIPSYFCTRMPIALADIDLSPVLVYPVDHSITERTGDGLAELIGNTRVEVLKAVLSGASTSDVAKRVGISVATASHHTTVLRNAGTITSDRMANRVIHRPTSMGLALLAGNDDRRHSVL